MNRNASRNWFFEQIGTCIEQEDWYIVSADLAGPPFDIIREKTPERFVPVGIAEQNMIAVACGIALAGKRVIAYTSNPFTVFRSYDQIRNAVALMNLPLTIVGVGTGFSISQYGASHYITEDISLMSLCPGLEIITVSDIDIAGYALEYIRNDTHKPCYIRFDNDCNDRLGSNENLDFGWRYIVTGEKTLIVCQGITSQLVKDIFFEKENPAIIDIIKNPFDEKSFVDEIEKYDRLVVVEEQQLRGGLGSIILEICNDNNMRIPMKRLGINYGGHFPKSYGSREYWHDYFGITRSELKKIVCEE